VLAIAGGTIVGRPVAAQVASPVPGEASEATPPSLSEQLEAAFPATLAGRPLDITSFSGDEVIAGVDADDPVLELVELTAAHGSRISDFSIASASVRDRDPFIGLLAATIDGVPAIDVIDDLTRLILETDQHVESTREIIAGLEVTRVGPGSGLTGAAVVYVLPVGDIAWYVVAEPGDLEEILSALA